MARTENTENTQNTATAPPAGFAVVEGGLPSATRVDPSANPYYAAVEYSKNQGVAVQATVGDMKGAHQLIRRAASALDTGIKIRPSLNSDEAKSCTNENPAVVTFQAGRKRGTKDDAGE